jgi:voltage-gated potassium channel
MSTIRSHFRYAYKNFISGNYNLLLIFLVLIFIFRPYAPSSFYLGVWKMFLTGTLMSAIFNCDHTKWVKHIVSCMAIPSLILTWLDLFFPHEFIVVAFAFFTILFIAICTASILYDVVWKARVTSETLRGVVCAYFLVAFMFSYLYFLIEYITPGSFIINGKIIPIFPHNYYLSEMLYFSFITLLTIGYGDIVAVKDLAQTACVLQGIIGQFYIAILVSRLVAIYSFNSDKHILETLERDLKKKKIL